MAGFCSFRYLLTPQMVPPVPTPAAQVRDFAFGLPPDFGAGGVVVRGRVRQVIVLVGVEGVGRFLAEAAGHRVVAARVFGGHIDGANHYLGAHGAQNVLLFLALLVAHHEDGAVAFGHGGQGQAHARVAAGALDDGAAGLQLARLLGVVNHADGHAVLHRVAGVEILDFGQDSALYASRVTLLSLTRGVWPTASMT